MQMAPQTKRRSKNVEWEVVLLVDCSEHKVKLDSVAVNFERRRLPVFDYVWIARPDVNKMPPEWNEPVREVILGTAVERKTMDDLCDSLNRGNKKISKFSRFVEQRMKMKYSPMANKVFLLEGTRMNYRNIGKRYIHTRIQRAIQDLKDDGFTIHRADTPAATAEFLFRKHHEIAERFFSMQQSCHEKTMPTYQEAMTSAIWIRILCRAASGTRIGQVKVNVIANNIFPTRLSFVNTSRRGQAKQRLLKAFRLFKRSLVEEDAHRFCTNVEALITNNENEEQKDKKKDVQSHYWMPCLSSDEEELDAYEAAREGEPRRKPSQTFGGWCDTRMPVFSSDEEEDLETKKPPGGEESRRKPAKSFVDGSDTRMPVFSSDEESETQKPPGGEESVAIGCPAVARMPEQKHERGDASKLQFSSEDSSSSGDDNDFNRPKRNASLTPIGARRTLSFGTFASNKKEEGRNTDRNTGDGKLTGKRETPSFDLAEDENKKVVFRFPASKSIRRKKRNCNVLLPMVSPDTSTSLGTKVSSLASGKSLFQDKAAVDLPRADSPHPSCRSPTYHVVDSAASASTADKFAAKNAARAVPDSNDQRPDNPEVVSSDCDDSIQSDQNMTGVWI